MGWMSAVSRLKRASTAVSMRRFPVICLGMIGVVCEMAAATPLIHKPPSGTQINWAHPLAAGLVSAVPLNVHVGQTSHQSAPIFQKGSENAVGEIRE